MLLLDFKHTYQVLNAYTLLSGKGDYSPFEQLCLFFSPIFLDKPFSCLTLCSHPEKYVVSLFIRYDFHIAILLCAIVIFR